MKTFALTLSALLVATGALAQFNGQAVAVYKNKISVHVTGGNARAKQKITGYTVLDPEGPRAIQLLVLDQFNQYIIRTNLGLFSQFILLGKSKTELCLVQAHTNGHGGAATAAAKGTYSQFTIDNLLWSGVKVLSWTGRGLYSTGGYEESTGTLVLDLGETTAAGELRDTVDSAIERLSTRLLNDGYTRADDPFQ
jgi:hypothetical protein